MAVHPLRPATDRCLGRPLPCQPANQTRAHPVPPEFFTQGDVSSCAYAVLAAVSSCYPPVQGRLPTRYSPVRHSVPINHPKNLKRRFVRLACVRHAASVHPEPGSNSQIKCSRCQIRVQNHWFFSCHYCLFRFWTFVLFHGLSCRHHSQENPNEIWINVQGCFVIQLSRFLAFFFAKAFIFYHITSFLSRIFLKTFSSFFEDFCFFCDANFYILTHDF